MKFSTTCNGALRAVIFVLLTLSAASCNRDRTDNFVGESGVVPDAWHYVGNHTPCLLEVGHNQPRAFRVNCFEVAGKLHIHSHRFVDFNQLFGETWVATVARDNRVRVLISDKIYELNAILIDDPERRRAILAQRYERIPQGIRVFRLVVR